LSVDLIIVTTAMLYNLTYRKYIKR
jgi:hypothetical protein